VTTQYTPILKLALPVTGELSGTWGTVVNDNITSMVEQAVAGLSTINTWTANAHTLTTADGTSSEARCAMLVLATGSGGTALTAAGEVICPAASKLYVVKNGSAYAVTVKTSAGTGVAIPAGDTAFVFCDGTNVNACVTTIVNGHISGNLTVDGNTTLGDATSDTITATARFNTDLLPSTDNARDLGSTANSWRTLYCETSVIAANITISGNTISSTDTNGNITLAPNGTGDVQLDADTIRVGDSGANVTITSNGAGDLILNTNSGTNSGSITIEDGANGNIALAPNGTGQVTISTALDLTNLEVTNIKAKDGSASITLADSTGVASFTANPILSGGTANGVVYLNASKVATTGSSLTFNGTIFTAPGDIVSSGANPLFQGLSATGSVALSNSTAGAYIRAYGASHATRPNYTDFINGSSTSTFDASGNLGLGVTPSAKLEIYSTNNAFNALQVRYNGSNDAMGFGIGNSNGFPYLGYNTKSQAAVDGPVYERSGPAAQLRMDNGSFKFNIAPSGTANTTTITNGVSYTIITSGNQTDFGAANNNVGTAFTATSSGTLSSGTVSQNISFTQAMTLDASGNLLVGNTAQSGTANRAAVFSANKFGLSVIDTTAQATGVGGALNLGGNYRTTGDAQAFCRVEASKENSTDNNFAYAMAFSTTPNGGTFTERARITSGGDFLVGLTSSTAKFHVTNGASPASRLIVGAGGGAANTLYSTLAAGDYVSFETNGAERARITSGGDFRVKGAGTAGSTDAFQVSGSAPADAARITSDGNFFVGTTALLADTNYFASSPGNAWSVFGHVNGTASGVEYVKFYYNNGQIGSISQNGTTAVAYNTSSDYRLKDNPQPLTNSGAFIDALQPKTWNWKADGTKGVGFIAHEVQEVSPGTVVGAKDAVDADGKPVMQAMEYGSAEFIANIVAELQSLRARVAELEASK